ncbi:hypothetical protein ELI_3074 [Eubacterium callanderi]|uniref:Uncharacterized protein n=1 Tax=Eubacterium callanderi TaxID=53442 RepID=E3GPC2_9FIRM|nr:hypothetical protein ELI_3074 [Eubacterium callanderi]
MTIIPYLHCAFYYNSNYLTGTLKNAIVTGNNIIHLGQ